MGVDGHLHGVIIEEADSKEQGEVELMTAGIKVFGDIFTDYYVSKDGGNIILGEGVNGGFCDLCVEPGAALNINIFVMVFMNKFEILIMCISVDACGLLSLIKLKVCNSGISVKIRFH